MRLCDFIDERDDAQLADLVKKLHGAYRKLYFTCGSKEEAATQIEKIAGELEDCRHILAMLRLTDPAKVKR